MKLGVGKFRGFKRISNTLGQFQMLALDQRGSLNKMLSQFKGKIEPKDLSTVKKEILKSLSDKVTAVLIDGEYGFPDNLKYIYNQTGVILSLEKSGYKETDDSTKGRISEIYRKDAVTYAKKSGVDAIKLLIYWSDNASDKTKEQQRQLVEIVGHQCFEEDILYILEILTYDSKNGKRESILNAMKIFSENIYNVDLFKVEPILTEPHFDISPNEIYEHSNGKPWVILSGGMDVEQFKEILKWNCQLGSSGFLAGRVIWKGAPAYINDLDSMQLHLNTSGTYNLEVLKINASDAVPFFKTPYFGGLENIQLV
ncbi:MAG: tagatose 1,6-diphosphate aldolase [Nitrososphaeria archaeon]